ncbi:MAG TPA: AlkA N-terminal domain-containing protein [Acidimicrobiales bacterium]|nr:AlkA N-terminal domain-containing protein [Acidimicrobiales bacterium]
MDDHPTPRAAARDAGDAPAAGPAWLDVRLPHQAPLPLDELLAFLAARAVPGVEEVVGGTYRRVLALPGGPAVVELGPGGTARAGEEPGGTDPSGQEAGGTDPGSARPAGEEPSGTDHGTTGWVACRLSLADPGDRPAAVAACRRLLDLDTDPAPIDGALGADPALAPLVAATPGRRAPVHVDAHELAFRAVLGQQVSLAAARRLAGRLAEICGVPLGRPAGGLTVAFPTAAAVAEADLDLLGMPGARRTTLRTLAAALAGGLIDLAPGADAAAAEEALLAVRGIGPWTAAYVRMRGLGDPDVFLPGDVGVRRALAGLGLVDAPATGERWRPWRSYAVHHLWASLG